MTWVIDLFKIKQVDFEVLYYYSIFYRTALENN